MRRVLPLALLVGVSWACQDTQPNQMTAPGGVPTALPSTLAASPAATRGDKLTYSDASDKVLLRVKVTADGFALSDADSKALGTVHKSTDHLKFRDAADVERLKVKRKDDGAEVEDAAGKRLYRLRTDDGAWKIEDAADNTLAKAKPKPDGFELRDKDGRTIAKVKTREGKVVFETEEGVRLAEAKGTTSARAVMWLALDKLSLAERASIWAYFETLVP